MPTQFKTIDGKTYKLVFTKFITFNGVRKYHPTGGVYRFWVEVKQFKGVAVRTCSPFFLVKPCLLYEYSVYAHLSL